jgi:hypothetical protein
MRRATPVALVALLVPALASCGNDFDPASKIASVRVLASRADKPYARPGDSVELEVLAVDGRADRSRPMAVYWIPAPCINPPEEAYYKCYPSFAATFARGADATPHLVRGSKLSLRIPSDILAAPFANVFAFSIACAGHVRYVGRRGPSPQAAPFACVDSGGAELGTEDFVFAYSRVFVTAGITNDNPTIEGVTLDGKVVDPAAGITLAPCPTPSRKGEDPTCRVAALDVVVPPRSQELDPTNLDVARNVQREGLWVAYYSTGGKLKDDVRVLYDARAGKVSSAVDFEAPATTGDATLWAVVHDNRGGTSWIEVPLRTRR